MADYLIVLGLAGGGVILIVAASYMEAIFSANANRRNHQRLKDDRDSRIQAAQDRVGRPRKYGRRGASSPRRLTPLHGRPNSAVFVRISAQSSRSTSRVESESNLAETSSEKPAQSNSTPTH